MGDPRRLSIAVLGASLVLSPAAHAQYRLVTITIENRSARVADLEPSIEAFGNPPQDFTKKASDKFEYRLPVRADRWFNTVDIKLLWKSAYVTRGESKDDFEQRIVLRIRRDFPETFSFSVYFANDRSQAEMSRLERLKDENEQFEVFFRSWQIARYYRDTLGPESSFTKRAAKLFFTAAVRLAETPQYFVKMSDEADEFIQASYGGSTSYSQRANLARSMYWLDLTEIEKYVSRNECGTARLLLEEFRDLQSQEPEIFKLKYGHSPAILDAKAQFVESKCGPDLSDKGPPPK